MNARFNEKLGAWLLVKENTKAKLAKQLGISRPTLDGRISGRSKWTWDEAVAVAEIVGCTLDDLAGVTASS